MPRERARRVLGADGCRGGGWVVAVLDEGPVRWEWAADTKAVVSSGAANPT